MTRSLVHHTADCLDCDFYVDARNAQGVGARHAQTQGHCVEVQLGIFYGSVSP